MAVVVAVVVAAVAAAERSARGGNCGSGGSGLVHTAVVTSLAATATRAKRRWW